MKIMRLMLLCLVMGLAGYLWAQEDDKKLLVDLPRTATSSHTLKINNQSISYTTTAGYLTLQNDLGEPEAHLFYIAYHKPTEKPSSRPITFSFNGGPGSSSVWLHMGALGPKRVQQTDKGANLPPPFALTDNPHSWLDLTDMVFIDPVTTGFSRSADPEKEKEYHNFQGDVESVARFIENFISKNNRWASPKFLIGESYGTTRAAALSHHLLQQHNIYLNGVILVSTVLNFQTLRDPYQGNNLPYPLLLPTLAATSHYHGRLPEQKQALSLPALLEETRSFVYQKYVPSLFKGASMTAAEEQALAIGLQQYTGLDPNFIKGAHYRISTQDYTKELLRDSAQIVGRLDSRFTGTDTEITGSEVSYDPSMHPTIMGSYAAMLNDYLRRELGFETHLSYEILTPKVRPWSYESDNAFLQVADDLKLAISKNPKMKVWVLNGYYDLATPFFATEYTFNQMPLTHKQRQQIHMTYYEAGHMMYIHWPSLIQMKDDAVRFYDEALP